MSIMQDLRYAIRLLRRAPGFTAVALLVLALGIGANAAVFTIVNALLLRPLPGRTGELVGIFNRDRTHPGSYRAFSYPAYIDIRDGNDAFERVMAHTFTLAGVHDGDVTRRSLVSIVSSNYFSTLNVTLAAGRGFHPEEEIAGRPALVAVASYETWRRKGLDPQFIGSTVKVNSRDFTIVGVAPKGFTGTLALVGPEWWFPLGAYDDVSVGMFRDGGPGSISERSHADLVLAGILKRPLTLADGQSRLEPLAQRLAQAYPDTDRDRSFVVSPLQRLGVSTNPGTDQQERAISALLLVMSGLVLLVACLNLANLMLARGTARRKEIALRLALGGSRTRILRQLMVEALLLSGAGATAGLFLAWWTTALLAASMSTAWPISVAVDAAPDIRVFAATAGFAILSTLLFALGPAWLLSKTDLVSEMKRETRGASGLRGRFGRWLSGPTLVVGQLAVSLVLVAVGGLFVRSALNVATSDAGFAVNHQLVAGIDPSMAGYDETRGREIYRSVLDRVRGLPGVESASTASTVPFGDITEGHRVRLPGASEDAAHPIYQVIGGDYFSTLGLHMLRGREFTPLEESADPRAARVAIIDDPLARQLFATDDPIGRQILIRSNDQSPARSVEIVGVAPGLRHDIFDPAPVPHLYAPFGGDYRSTINLHVRVAPGAVDQSMLETIGAELRRIDSRVPIVGLRTMAAHRDASVATWAVRTAASMFTAFGVLALLLATIGVYGLQAYDVSRRTREIGIRMALGARARDVAMMVVGGGVRTIAWGLSVGLLAAMGIGKLVSGFLFRASPFDPVVFAVAVLVLTAAALLASFVPARRAAGVQPLDALRAE